eukprot:XP_015139229.1 39S ribosomal protein L33, mitochondrial isoform X1 [Gallus gallus]
MFLTAASLAKSKSKYILVRMKSAAETGYCFNVRRLRLQEKLVLLRYDPIANANGSITAIPLVPRCLHTHTPLTTSSKTGAC